MYSGEFRTKVPLPNRHLGNIYWAKGEAKAKETVSKFRRDLHLSFRPRCTKSTAKTLLRRPQSRGTRQTDIFISLPLGRWNSGTSSKSKEMSGFLFAFLVRSLIEEECLAGTGKPGWYQSSEKMYTLPQKPPPKVTECQGEQRSEKKYSLGAKAISPKCYFDTPFSYTWCISKGSKRTSSSR